jgi:hypothetical protein
MRNRRSRWQIPIVVFAVAAAIIAITTGLAKACLTQPFAENSPGTVGPTYSAAGIQWDYDGMTNIPWKRSRVLK